MVCVVPGSEKDGQRGTKVQQHLRTQALPQHGNYELFWKIIILCCQKV